MMETKVMIYEGNEIEFSFGETGNGNMMICATEMAKIFDKQIGHFLENESTQKFILVCLNNRNSDYSFEKKTDLVISKPRSGTWMHRVLALKFAAWLNPEFELWIYTTIESLLFGNYVRREESFRRTLSIQDRLEELELRPEKTGADFEEYLNLRRQLKTERARRRSLTVMEIQGLEQKTLFETI